jgi:hypothetical protein
MRLRKPRQYTTVSSIGLKLRPTPQTPKAMSRYFASPCITRSSGGTPVNASMAPVGVVRLAPVIPKHAHFYIQLSLFLALAV